MNTSPTRVDFTKTGKPVKHGTVSAYQYSNCRCDECRTASTAYQLASRHRQNPEMRHGRVGRPCFKLTPEQEAFINDVSLSASEAAERAGLKKNLVQIRRKKVGIRSARSGKRKAEVPTELLLDPALTHDEVAELAGVGVHVVTARRKDLGFRRYYPDIPWYEARGYIAADGYVRLQLPGHPLAFGAKKQQAMEHQVVIYEQHFKGDVEWNSEWAVHHRNGEKTDNRIANLILFFSRGDHTRHHADLRRGESEVESLRRLGSETYLAFDSALTDNDLVSTLTERVKLAKAAA